MISGEGEGGNMRNEDVNTGDLIKRSRDHGYDPSLEE